MVATKIVSGLSKAGANYEAGGRLRTLALLGDSMSAQNGDPAGFVSNAIGYASWANVLSYGALRLPPAQNFGVSGESTRQVALRVGSVLTAAPGFCCVLAGTNDVLESLTAAQSIANLAVIYDALQSAGIVVIAIPILPRNSYAAGQLANILTVNAWIRRQRFERRSFYVADASQDLSDPSTAFDLSAGMTVDGLHPSALAAYYIGRRIAAIINALVPGDQALFSSSADVYSSSLPTGNLIANGFMAGTSGTLTGATGVAATSWTVDASTSGGATVVASKATVNGRARQKLVLSGSFNSAFGGVYVKAPTITPGNFSSGDVLDFHCEYEVGAGLENVANISLALFTQQTISGVDTAVTMEGMRGGVSPVYILPAVAWGGVISAPRMIVQGAVTSISAQLRILLKNSSGASLPVAGEISLGQVTLRKVQ